MDAATRYTGLMVQVVLIPQGAEAGEELVTDEECQVLINDFVEWTKARRYRLVGQLGPISKQGG